MQGQGQGPFYLQVKGELDLSYFSRAFMNVQNPKNLKAWTNVHRKMLLWGFLANSKLVILYILHCIIKVAIAM